MTRRVALLTPTAIAIPDEEKDGRDASYFLLINIERSGLAGTAGENLRESPRP